MINVIQNALQFLILTAIDLYAFVLVVRFILALSGASHANPITQFVVKLTSVVIRPLRIIIPNIYHVETATLFLIVLLEMLRFYIFALFTVGAPHLTGLFVVACGAALGLIIQAFFYAIILQVILSFVQPQSLFNLALKQFIAPVVKPLQRIIPIIAGFDITPLIALVSLNLLTIVAIDPIKQYGLTLW